MDIRPLLILLTWAPITRESQDHAVNMYSPYESSKKAPRRVIMLMEQYAQEAEQRAREMHEMRFMYEESPHYEFGYLMHEVIERYRKMVYHVRRPMEYQTDNVYMTIKHTETIQNLYLEIYHLVNMMHEIELKYSYLPEFQDLGSEIDLQKVQEQEQMIKLKERLESRERKKAAKFYKKLKELAIIQGEKHKALMNRNKLWPLDYGWEVAQWW